MSLQCQIKLYLCVLGFVIFISFTHSFQDTIISNRNIHRKLSFDGVKKPMIATKVSISSSNYKLLKLNPQDDWQVTPIKSTNKNPTSSNRNQLNIDPIRFILFNCLAVILALGADFVGITSNLISNTFPETFQKSKIDQIYAIDGYRRYVDKDDHYEFRFPSRWLIDQAIILAEIREREIPAVLRNSKPRVIRPDVAFGPAGTDTSENVSVMKTQVLPGFSLSGTLGQPTDAANFLLQNFIAPASSGKEYELIQAYAEERDGKPVYQFEYIVRKGTNFNQHSVSAIMCRNNQLFTITAVVPESKWPIEKQKINTIINSFQLE